MHVYFSLEVISGEESKWGQGHEGTSTLPVMFYLLKKKLRDLKGIE